MLVKNAKRMIHLHYDNYHDGCHAIANNILQTLSQYYSLYLTRRRTIPSDLSPRRRVRSEQLKI